MKVVVAPALDGVGVDNAGGDIAGRCGAGGDHSESVNRAVQDVEEAGFVVVVAGGNGAQLSQRSRQTA